MSITSMLAKQRMEEVLLTEQMRRNKTLVHLIQSIADGSRQLESITRDVRIKEEEIQRLNSQVPLKEIAVNNLLMNAALVILRLREQQEEFGMEDLFIEGNEIAADARLTMNQITQRLRLIYGMDVFAEPTPQLMELIRDQTPDWK